MPPFQNEPGQPTLSASPIIVMGNGNLTYTIALDLLKAGYSIELYTDNPDEAGGAIHNYMAVGKGSNGTSAKPGGGLQVQKKINNRSKAALAIVITQEDLALKKDNIGLLEKALDPQAIIAINAESIALSEIQKGAVNPSRIIGLNWTEPAHTTKFLEIVTNSIVDIRVTQQVGQVADALGKDPYTVEELGVRSRLMSAMIREAFYLVENDYASVEDIDRACRNDAGYYLPFAGNCRYMDLMGTYAYGMVMKDLNADLSKEQHLPAFFEKIIKEGGKGMENRKGIYQYTPEEVKVWRKVFNEFNYRIEEIMKKYPFDYKKDNMA
jgi:3-hydroxybutyryl-CoA dehydrogenase